MAATVKPIEAKAVHLIQSGQVIVDLCSVVKELVENSLDAGADVVEVRFKNYGLDEIEVQDNGSGVASANYDNLALKHYTSKLATYDDLDNLSTFGFRGEALSSLCALSTFAVTTAQADEAPKGHRLTFESSGKLKTKSLVACQKGTTVTVSGLFANLPVRQKELAKNIRREYAKVLGVLHAYACISINVKFTVKNSMSKGKSSIVFATRSNPTTRENIANVYGAKTLSALAPLNLELSLESASGLAQNKEDSTSVVVEGHISKPIFGEGRQTPDRQMFFVNGRPCGLPQIAKAMNEVYKFYNISQSPFIFANFRMDTKAYDVNVSPDKRSIFLHNAAALIESLKDELVSMFDDHDHTMPQMQLKNAKLSSFKQTSIHRASSNDSVESSPASPGGKTVEGLDDDRPKSESLDDSARLWHSHFGGITSTRMAENDQSHARINRTARSYSSRDSVDQSSEEDVETTGNMARDSIRRSDDAKAPSIPALSQSSMRSHQGPVQQALDRMRPRRSQPDVAMITIGDRTITKAIGLSSENLASRDRSRGDSNKADRRPSKLSGALRDGLSQFAAPSTQEIRELGRFEGVDIDQTSLIGSDSSTEDDDVQSMRTGRNEDDQSEHVEQASRSATPETDEGGVESESGSHYVDDADEKIKEQARVEALIRAAEKTDVKGHNAGSIRTDKALKGGRLKDSTTGIQVVIEVSSADIRQRYLNLYQSQASSTPMSRQLDETGVLQGGNPEETLSLTVSKADFANMHIVGQFNLGFILAVRPRSVDDAGEGAKNAQDELFIIDQHASDEKYNFERLQAETVVGHQRMVRPVTLDLTAVEEEILMDAGGVLEKNGFVVEMDLSGDKAVGRRCQLVSLPLSREVVFNTRDLDELIHLLSETPMTSDLKSAPRPSKVRKMFAMRACRSSIMIGKTLSRKQMHAVVQHMGTIDKPWNCPHGRPTMRHLATLDSLEESLWQEGDGVLSGGGDVASTRVPTKSERGPRELVWRQYVK